MIRLLIFLASLGSSFGFAAIDSIELAKSAKPAVALLLLYDGGGNEVGSGTGFFISADGKMVTNSHVIADADRVEATLADGRKIPILGALADDPINDLAILQSSYQPTAKEFLPLAALDRAQITPGEPVVVIGAPRGLAGTLSEGIVSAIRSPGDLAKFDQEPRKGQAPLLQITAAISPGSSGSPVLDSQGQIVGVASSNLGGGQSLNFAVPVSQLHALLGRIAPNAIARPFKGRSIFWNLLISAAFFASIYWAFKRLCKPSGPEPRRRATERY